MFRTRRLLKVVSCALLGLTAGQVLAAPGTAYNAGAPSPVFQSDAPKTREASHAVSRDGEATYSIPIVVPPGRNGAEPRIALEYGSRAPLRGGVAAGWSLPIPTIAVDTSKGRAQGTAYQIGGQRLVEVDEPAKSAQARAFRLEGDTSFTRYEKINDGSEAGYWIAKTPDGTTYFYGNTPDSKDTRTEGAPGDLTYGGEGRWFLTETRDASGNQVVYNYKRVFGQARNTTVLSTPVDIVLTEIQYGKNVFDPSSEHHAIVQLNWKLTLETCRPSDVPIGAQFSYKTGIRTYEGAKKLTSIWTFVKTGPGGRWTRSREWNFEYDADAAACDRLHGPLRVLSSVTQRAYAPDGTVTTLPPATFEYGPLEMDFAGVEPEGMIQLGSGKDPHDPTKPGGWPALQTARIDIDGDGRAEPLGPEFCSTLPQQPWANGLYPNNDRSNLRAFEGCSLTAQVTHRGTDRGRYRCGEPTDFFGYRYMDVDGDGLLDLVAALNYQKGRYDPSDDPAVTQAHPEAYPACSAMPPPACVDAQGERVPCLLNSRVQLAIPATPDGDRSWDGVSNGLFSRRLWGDNTPPPPPAPEGQSTGTRVECPANTCAESAECRGAATSCCGIAYCPEGDTPLGDPLDPGQDFLRGQKPTVLERPRTPSGNAFCGHVPDMHCGYYVLWVYKNKGNNADGSWFDRTPRIVHSPVPLESDQMTSGQGAAAMANASAWRAIVDLDGDGYPDGVYQTPDDLIPPSKTPDRRFRVWFGAGDGSFVPYAVPGGRGWSTPASDYPDTYRPTIELSGTSPVSPITSTTTFQRHFNGTINTFRDINGDGLLDYVRGAKVFFNTGTGFELAGTSFTAAGTFLGVSQRVRVRVGSNAVEGDDAYSSNTIRLLDLDNDGLEDIVQLSPPAEGQYDPFATPAGATMQAYVNVGDSFRPVSASAMARIADWRHALAGVTTEDGHAWISKTDVLDENGDGLFDLAVPDVLDGCPSREANGYNYNQCALLTRIRRAPSRPLHVLKAVNNGLGGRLAFEYASSTDASVVSKAPGSRLPTPIWVVKSVTVTAGTPAEPPQRTEYAYANPVSRSDRFGRFGFRGFESVTSTGPTPSTGRRKVTRDEYAFDQDPRGLLRRTKVAELFTLQDDREDLLSVSDNVYVDLPLFDGPLAGDPAKVKAHAVRETRNVVCQPAQSGMGEDAVAACLAGGQLLRTIRTWSPFAPTTGIPGRPDNGGSPSANVLYAVTSTRRTDREGELDPGDRIDGTQYELRYSATEYNLLAKSSERKDGRGALLEKEETTYEPSSRALPSLHKTWVEGTTVATRSMDYDSVGNLVALLRPNQLPRLATGQALYVRYAYDPFRVHLASTTNELGHVRGYSYDLATGALLAENGIPQRGITPVVRRRIDGFGRVLEKRRTVETAPGQYAEQLVYSASYSDSPSARKVTQNVLVDGSQWLVTTSVFDGLGRVVREEKPSVFGAGIVRRQYDGAGNLVTLSMPSPTGTGEAFYRLEYDALQRVARQVDPASAEVLHEHAGNIHIVRENPKDGGPKLYRRLVHDAFGRLTVAYEGHETQTATRYAYDASDRVTSIVDADGVTTTITYDLRGARKSVSRAGNTLTYDYDLNGNRTVVYHPTPSGRIDPLKYASYWTYDAIDRVRSYTPMDRNLTDEQLARYFSNESSQQTITVYTYDEPTRRNGNGQLTTVHAPHGKTTYDYTVEGLVAEEVRDFAVRVDGATFRHAATEKRSYNALGLVKAIEFPDTQGEARTVSRYDYDDRGRPLAAYVREDSGSFVQVGSFPRNDAGLVTSHDGPFFVRQSFAYDDRGRLRRNELMSSFCGSAGCTSGLVTGESILYYESGHPKAVTDLAKNRTLDLAFNDHLELVSARSAGSNAYVGEFDYSPSGRVKTVALSSGLAGADVWSRNVTHRYEPHDAADRADPAAVRALRDNLTNRDIATLTYDPSGNLVRKVADGTTTDYAYDAADQLREVRRPGPPGDAFEVYWYDHAGERVLTYRAAKDGSPARLVHRFGTTEIEVDAAGTVRKTTVDVHLGGRAVARVTDRNVAAREYLFHGSLGNLLAVVSGEGETTARFGYGPYGETLYEEGENAKAYDRRYEAKAKDDLSGLSYFGRRYYDPHLLGWTQADPLYRFLPDLNPRDPRRMGLYTYVLNNPVSFIDPDGRDSQEDRNIGAKIVGGSKAVMDQDGITILGVSYGVGTGGAYAEATVVSVEAEAGGFVASADILTLGAEASKDGITAQASLLETGVGVRRTIKGTEVTAKVLFGLSAEAELKWKERVKVKVVPGIGGELEVEWAPPEQVDVAPPDHPVAMDSAPRQTFSTEAPLPPPRPAPAKPKPAKKKARPAPKPKKVEPPKETPRAVIRGPGEETVANGSRRITIPGPAM